jgi:FkbH-like protein
LRGETGLGSLARRSGERSATVGLNVRTDIGDELYRCPRDLAVTETALRRVLIVGSCLVEGWENIFRVSTPPCDGDYVLFNNVGQVPEPPRPLADYDFQIVQVSLRGVLPEGAYFRLSYREPAAYQQLFEETRERISRSLEALMRWNREHGLLTFACNFIVPQQNPMGRLLPRYDLRNMVYFIEKLNEVLSEELARYDNAYLLDLDQIVSTYGRRHFQDDVAWHGNHGGALSDFEHERDRDRLESIGPMSDVYPVRTADYLGYFWNELVAMYRTVRQIDQVKLVIVDLDDTMWRGVAAELTSYSGEVIEGWPLGLVEALGYLKRRGVLLAIVSKNEERRAHEIWSMIVGENRLSLSDFAVQKINWRPKADNIEEILSEVNLLPRSVVFIDDNPAERFAVQSAFPEIRAFGPNPYLWRRILLWSPETQVAAINAEAAARTEMVQAQIKRETERKQLSREEFLATLGVEITLFDVADVADPAFQRALELVNKSNQFNTTGRRWTPEEAKAFFAGRGRFVVFDVKDRFTAYGIVGVAIVAGDRIEQFVMSCRVAGLDVEIAVVAELLAGLRSQGSPAAVAVLHETDANALCRDLYARCEFTLDANGELARSTAGFDPPAHVQLTRREALL